MNNSDMPAMPSADIDLDQSEADYGGGRFVRNLGLTKLEHFAGLAMQGLLVNMGRNEFNDVDRIAEGAVNAAKALLAELEKGK